MVTRNTNTHTRTLCCGSVCAKLVLPVALFMPALMALQGFSEGKKKKQISR